MAFDPVFGHSKRFLVFDLGDSFGKVLEHMHLRHELDYVILRKTEKKSGKLQFFIVAGENFFQSIDIPNIVDFSGDIDFDFTLNQAYGPQIAKIKPAHTIKVGLDRTTRKAFPGLFENWTPVLELHAGEPVSVLEPAGQQNKIRLPTLKGIRGDILQYLPEDKISEILNELEPSAGPDSPASKPAKRDKDIDADAPAAVEGGNGLPPVPPLHVFPHADPKPEHVVQKKNFTLTVTLEKERSETTPGGVDIPDDKKKHTVKVHLQIRRSSYMQELIFHSDHGTSQSAVFKDVPAPELVPNKDRSTPERQIETLRLNFYMDHRWCGEALRNIELLYDDSVLPGEIPVPDEPRWRRELSLEPGAARPDLLVRIQDAGNGKYSWWIDSPRMEFDFSNLKARDSLSNLGNKNQQAKFVRSVFEKFADEELNAIRIDSVEGGVGQIFAKTSATFQSAYWQLFEKARQDHSGNIQFETIQFISDEPYIPWELMRLHHKKWMPVPEILSLRHSVGRWVAPNSCSLRQSISVKQFLVFASDYKDDKNVSQLESAIVDRQFLEETLGAKARDLKIQPVHELLNQGGAEAVHFSCHGEMDQDNPDESTIRLEDDIKGFTPLAVLKPEVAEGLGKFHPFVFLNACELGGAGKVLNIVIGWPQAFIASGASSIIAPLWSVIDEHAADVSKEFYLQAKKSVTLGEALKKVRQSWKVKKSLTYLAYVLYGDPSAKIHFSS